MDKPEREHKPAAEAKGGNARLPPEGPHAREALTDKEKTPGTGALPTDGKVESDVGPD